MKKHLYIIVGLLSFLLGIIGAFTSIKLTFILAAGFLVFTLFLLDYEKATYVVALYIITDYVLRQFVNSFLLSNVWDELMFIFCVFLWLYKWLVYRKEKAYKWTPLEFPLIFFFSIGIFLLLVNAPDTRIGIEGLRAVIEYIFWFFVVVQLLKSPSGARHLIYILLFVGTFLGLDGIRQYLMKVPMPGNWVDKAEIGVVTRVFSILGNPNALASLMVLLIPVSISLIYYESKLFKKLFFAAAAMIMTICLVFTFTRGAWIGFVVAIFIFAMLKDKRLIIPLVLSVIAAMILVPSVWHRISYMLSYDYVINSLKGGRLGRWGIGLEMLKDNLWFGVGLGRFGGAVAANNKIPGTFYMDNYYLKTLVEMGLIGFSAFCLLIYNTVIWSFRAIKALEGDSYSHIAQGIFAGLCGVLVHCFFENVFEVPMMTTYFWLLTGVLMYLGYSKNNSLKKQPDQF